jgi:hypothetical protein
MMRHLSQWILIRLVVEAEFETNVGDRMTAGPDHPDPGAERGS